MECENLYIETNYVNIYAITLISMSIPPSDTWNDSKTMHNTKWSQTRKLDAMPIWFAKLVVHFIIGNEIWHGSRATYKAISIVFSVISMDFYFLTTVCRYFGSTVHLQTVSTNRNLPVIKYRILGITCASSRNNWCLPQYMSYSTIVVSDCRRWCRLFLTQYVRFNDYTSGII